MKKEDQHIKWLDGMRGIFALAIFNCHIIPNLFPQITNNKIWEILLYTPLSIFYTGGVGVAFFLVLTGISVTLKLYDKNLLQILAACIKRYYRLVFIVIQAEFLAGFLVKFGYIYIIPGNYDGSYLFFSKFQQYSIGLKDILYDACIRTFLDSSHLIGPFWMIAYEFKGAILISILIYLCRKMEYRIFVYIALLCFTIGINQMYYFILICGLIISDFYKNPKSIELKKIASSNGCYKLLCTIGLLIICCSRLYSFSSFNAIRNYQYISGLGFALLIAGLLVYREKNIFIIFMESKVIQFVAKNSFAIYGLHYVIISSIGCWCIMKFGGHTDLLEGITVYFVVFTITIMLSIIVTEINKFIQTRIINQLHL